jgi:hypothetical protein
VDGMLANYTELHFELHFTSKRVSENSSHRLRVDKVFSLQGCFAKFIDIYRRFGASRLSHFQGSGPRNYDRYIVPKLLYLTTNLSFVDIPKERSEFLK